DASLRELGTHRLKDLIRPEQIFQLVAADLPVDFPVLRGLDSKANNLPTQPTPLIGRERELEQLRALLGRTEGRLVTPSGPDGAGKSRLSVQVAADMLENFADGVSLVGLIATGDASVVPATIAQTLGVQEAGSQLLTESLIAHLRDKQLLLILDNFEQVAA